QPGGEALAAQPADPDPAHRYAVAGNELGLEPAGYAEPHDVPAAGAHLVGDGQARHHVASRPARHDHQRPAHAVPPRIICRFSKSIRSRIATAMHTARMLDPP